MYSARAPVGTRLRSFATRSAGTSHLASRRGLQTVLVRLHGRGEDDEADALDAAYQELHALRRGA